MRTRELRVKANKLIKQIKKDKKLFDYLHVHNSKDDRYWKVYINITGWYLNSYFDLTIQKSKHKERYYIANSVTDEIDELKEYLENKTKLKFKIV